MGTLVQLDATQRWMFPSAKKLKSVDYSDLLSKKNKVQTVGMFVLCYSFPLHVWALHFINLPTKGKGCFLGITSTIRLKHFCLCTGFQRLLNGGYLQKQRMWHVFPLHVHAALPLTSALTNCQSHRKASLQTPQQVHSQILLLLSPPNPFDPLWGRFMRSFLPFRNNWDAATASFCYVT